MLTPIKVLTNMRIVGKILMSKVEVVFLLFSHHKTYGTISRLSQSIIKFCDLCPSAHPKQVAHNNSYYYNVFRSTYAHLLKDLNSISGKCLIQLTAR